MFNKSMGGAELQMSRIRAGVIRYKVYKDHDVLVDEEHFPEGGKMQISPKLVHFYANEVDIQNQRLRLRRNTLFSGRKAGGGSRPVPNFITLFLRVLA